MLCHGGADGGQCPTRGYAAGSSFAGGQGLRLTTPAELEYPRLRPRFTCVGCGGNPPGCSLAYSGHHHD